VPRRTSPRFLFRVVPTHGRKEASLTWARCYQLPNLVLDFSSFGFNQDLDRPKSAILVLCDILPSWRGEPLAEEQNTLDLSSKSFDQFVEFFFNRDVVPDEKQFDYFLTGLAGERYDEAVTSSPAVVVEHMTKLFSEFAVIGPKYSLAQLDQGIWGILGEKLRLYELLWDSSVPLELRVQCIRSMLSVYSDFVSKSKVEVMPGCFDMWWDLILHGFWFQQKLFERHTKMGDISKLDAESRLLLDVMFETLKQIVGLPDARTQGYALHGLGHLHHPAVRQTVQEFIDNHKTELTEQHLRWVERCRDGTVM
jgi:hypothetical protein